MLICDCLLLISFYLLFVIYAVSVYFCHIYLYQVVKRCGVFKEAQAFVFKVEPFLYF